MFEQKKKKIVIKNVKKRKKFVKVFGREMDGTMFIYLRKAVIILSIFSSKKRWVLVLGDARILYLITCSIC